MAEIKDIDFGQYFISAKQRGEVLNPAVMAQAFSNIKKSDPSANFSFSREDFKKYSEELGEDTAAEMKSVYTDMMDFSSVADQQDIISPIAIKNFRNDAEGIANFSSLASELKHDPVYRHNSFYRPFQYRTFQEAAEANMQYFDKDGTVRKLKDSGDYKDIANPWLIGFGGNSLVVATNEFVAQNDPELLARIENGEVDPGAYYRDGDDNYIYRKLGGGEKNFDHVRSIFGPRTVYNGGILKESAKGFYDGVLGLVDGAGALAYYSQVPVTKTLSMFGLDSYEKAHEAWFDDFMSSTARMKSAGSMQEDKGLFDNTANFMKAVSNGIGQITGTMGTGYGVGIGLKGVNALSKASRMGKLAGTVAGDLAGGTTRLLNFGIAAKAGKEESMRHGLTKDESDVMGAISGAIMMATEYLTGSQFIPKMMGRGAYKETAERATQYYIDQAAKQGLTVTQLAAKNPQAFKNAVVKAHKWLEAAPTSRPMGFLQGFVGEAIQETSEDFMFSLVKEGYDLVDGNRKFDQDWNDVVFDLMGSFSVGGLSGGLTRFGTAKPKQAKADVIDTKRNNFIVNEVAGYNEQNLLSAIEDIFMKEGLASKSLSANRDTDGSRQLLSNDKGLNNRSENEFFRDLFRAQVEFAVQVRNELKQKMPGKQAMADKMYGLMGQTVMETGVSMDELTKQSTRVMEIEGMAAMRNKSILQGEIALIMAKTKSSQASPTLDKITELRIINDKVIALKRSGEADFSQPSIEERTALEMAYRDLTTETVTGFKANFEKLVKELYEAVKVRNEIVFETDKYNDVSREKEFALKRLEELKEAQAEEKKISDQLEELVKKEGYSTDIIEKAVEMQLIDGFMGSLQNGERAQRYAKNYRLNVMKQDFPEVFRGRTDYNMEDYETDKRGFEYFMKNSEDLINEEYQDSELLEAETERISVLGITAFSQMVELLNNSMKKGVVFTPGTDTLINDFFTPILQSVTVATEESFKNSESVVAGLLTVTDPGFDNGFLGHPFKDMFMAEGISGLISKINGQQDYDEFIQRVFVGLSREQIIERIESIDSSFLGYFDAEMLESFNNAKDNAIAGYFGFQQIFKLESETKSVINKLVHAKRNSSPEVNTVFAYAINQNKKFNDNYLPMDSITRILQKKQEAAEMDEKNFVDDGTLNSIEDQVRKNQRYLISRALDLEKGAEELVADEKTAVDISFDILEKIIGDIQKLRDLSEANRGDRFKRDYEVKSDYISSATRNLKSLNDILGLDLGAEIVSLDRNIPTGTPTEQMREMVDGDFKRIVEIEEIISEQIQGLNEKDSKAIINEFVLEGIPVAEKGIYLFKIFNGDHKNPFDPKNERDISEMKMNYLFMLSRGKIREFFTFTNEYLKERTAQKDFFPSQEQILIARQLFSKMNSEQNSNIENAFATLIGTSKDYYNPNVMLARGAAGAGKSSFVVNLAFEVTARMNSALGKPEANTLITAPVQDQIDNITGSFDKMKVSVNYKTFKLIGEDSQLDEITDGDLFKGVDYVVFDEATVFGHALLMAIDKAEQMNKKGSKKIKIILIGDELQKSGPMETEPIIYARSSPVYMERTLPLTTPYRSGKVESYDIGQMHRSALSDLSTFYIYLTNGIEYTMPDNGEKLNLNFKHHSYKHGTSDVFTDRILKYHFKNRETSYYQEGGVIKEGIRAYPTAVEVNEKFVNDYILSDDRKGMVLITEKKESTISVLKELFARSGEKITESELEMTVKQTSETQGLEFQKVYTNIEMDKSNFNNLIRSLQSLYVAESREVDALVMVSPEGTIDSKKVISKDSINKFSPLNFDQVDQNDQLIGDSLELSVNNEHIAAVIADLAGKIPVPPKPETSEDTDTDTDTDPDPDDAPLTDPPLEEDLTEPKPRKKMDDEAKKKVDDEIRENRERAEKVMDIINKMSNAEIKAKFQVQDMFKGCKLN